MGYGNTLHVIDVIDVYDMCDEQLSSSLSVAAADSV